MPSQDKVIALPQIVLKEIDGSHYYWVDNEYMPSVTHILGAAAPTGEGLKKFFLNNTPESAQEILETSGEFGTLIHKTIAYLLDGKVLDTEEKDEKGKIIYTDKAKKFLTNFQNWFAEFKPTEIKSELLVASKQYHFAGTLDLVCKIGDKIVLVDFKTSSAIHYNYEAQVAAYKQAYEEMYGIKVDEMRVLRLGAKTKIGYEYKLIERDLQSFLNMYNTFIDMNGGKLPEPPKVRVYPRYISLYEEIPQ